MKEIAQGSVDKVLALVDDPSHSQNIKRASFLSALEGIRSGVMTYKEDLVLPLIEKEMAERLQRFKGLSLEEETKLLALSNEQKKIVAENDKKLKNEFLAAAPAITHGTVKGNEKYKSYIAMVQSATK